MILDLFMVEREAAGRNIVGTPDHLALRKGRSASIIAAIAAWREKMAPLFEPSSAMGDALRYMKNQWSRLIAFLDDPLIPIHNNASEAALRIVADDVSLCTLSSSTWNLERSLVARNSRRATRVLAPPASLDRPRGSATEHRRRIASRARCRRGSTRGSRGN
jgi:hypothetical protein